MRLDGRGFRGFCAWAGDHGDGVPGADFHAESAAGAHIHLDVADDQGGGECDIVGDLFNTGLVRGHGDAGFTAGATLFPNFGNGAGLARLCGGHHKLTSVYRVWKNLSIDRHA